MKKEDFCVIFDWFSFTAKGYQLPEFLDFCGLSDVDFVDYDYHRALQFGEFVHIFAVLVRFLNSIGNIENHVGIADGGINEVHHILLQAVHRLEDSGSIGIDYLVVFPVDYSHYPVPGGLRLGCHDAELLAHHRVHKRGLADVRIPDNVDESRLKHRLPSSEC